MEKSKGRGESRQAAPEKQPREVSAGFWVQSVSQKAQAAIRNPEENPQREGMVEWGGKEKGLFPASPVGNCSPNEKQAHFSLSGGSMQRRIHLVFINLEFPLMARHRGRWL